MRGMIFRAFQDFVDEEYSSTVIDDALDLDDLKSSRGAYTSVGNYPSDEFIMIARYVSNKVGTPMGSLITNFGKSLFHVLAGAHPEMMAQFTNCFDLLESLENVIHRNVRKLYDNTELPYFQVMNRDGNQLLVLRYNSSRPFADLAEGLILGALQHYQLGDKLMVRRKDLSNDGKHAEFRISTNVLSDHHE